MGKYRVKEPVTYVEGKRVVMHIRPAEFVTIDDDVARKLGDKVESMDQPESKSEPDPKSAPKPGAQVPGAQEK